MKIADIGSLDLIFAILAFIAPGFIIIYWRSQYFIGRTPKQSENVISYVVLSTVYYALAYYPLTLTIQIETVGFWRSLAWFAIVIIGPSVLGIALGLATQKGILHNRLSFFGARPVSPYPTGWDWVFGRLNSPVFLLVTLQDGSTVAGYFGVQSLASNDPAERDIFIEEVYDVGEDGTWKRRPERQGILVRADAVRHIEVWANERNL